MKESLSNEESLSLRRRWVPFDNEPSVRAQDKHRRASFGRLRTGLVKKLKREGYWVRGVDIKEHEFAETQALWNSSINSARSTKTSYSTGQADEFQLLGLREPHNCWEAINLGEGACPEPVEGFDEVYQLAPIWQDNEICKFLMTCND